MTEAPPGRGGRRAHVLFAEVPERPGGRMPDFAIIGAAKAGTTALNAMLDQHPGLFMCPLKEPHYFSYDAVRARGDQWYRGLYADAGPGQLCGEASTSYSRHPAITGVAERLARANAAMKLIYILREPVARAEAEFVQRMKYRKNIFGEDYTHMSLDDYCEFMRRSGDDEYPQTLAASRYIDQIEEVERHFPASNLLILIQEDFAKTPGRVLETITDFLGAERFGGFDTSGRRNVTADFLAGVDRERGSAKFRRLPFYGAAKALLPDRAKALILKLTSGPSAAERLRLSPERRARLTEEFAEPNRRLAARIGTLPAGWAT